VIAFAVFGGVIAVLVGAWAWIGLWARHHGKRLADPTEQALQNRVDAESYGSVGMTTWDDDPK
jgi:hypothetical protein